MLVRLRLLLAVLVVVAATESVQAQGGGSGSRGPSQVPRYTPQSPTISPYLNLLSRNGSPAGNYYGLVRPLQRQQRINERVSRDSSEQQQKLNKLQDEQKMSFDQPNVKPTGTAGWFHDYGQVTPYQQTGHYYSQWDSAGGAPRRGRR